MFFFFIVTPRMHDIFSGSHLYPKTVDIQVQNIIISRTQHLCCFIIELFPFFFLCHTATSFLSYNGFTRLRSNVQNALRKKKKSNSFCFRQHSCLITARPHLPASPSLFSLCRRSKKHPSVPGAKQDEGLLLHCQPGPGGGLQDQDCGEVPVVGSWRSLL